MVQYWVVLPEVVYSGELEPEGWDGLELGLFKNNNYLQDQVP